MNIVVLAGGLSTERDVSLVTGKCIYTALKKSGHNAILIDVFLGYDGDITSIFEKEVDWAAEISGVSEVAPDIEKVKAMRPDGDKIFFGPNVITLCQMADIVFLGLHGDSGENGKVQAVFDMFGIKYTGTNSFSSALAMDKSVAKQLFNLYGVNTPKSYMLKGLDDTFLPDFPCVVKVCNGGSSVGVYIANNEQEYKKACQDAYGYESKIMIEQYIKGREFTCCVIEGKALPIVEIEPVSGFYDYKNKYQAGATIETCPAKASEELTLKIQQEAVKAYSALEIDTYARMDFLVDENENVYCLEANTLPGMTPTSLIPQEAAAIGVSYEELCEWIIRISLKKWDK